MKELRKLNNKELKDLWNYYKPKVRRLGKEEYKYLIEIERELNRRGI